MLSPFHLQRRRASSPRPRSFEAQGCTPSSSSPIRLPRSEIPPLPSGRRLELIRPNPSQQLLESQANLTEPRRLAESELDTTSRPQASQLQTLMTFHPIGQLFKKCSLPATAGFVFIPSAETLARWPDG